IRVIRALCSGNFGQVFLVQDTNTRKMHALKVISKTRLDYERYALIFEEQDILRRLAGNPEFLTLLASFEDKQNFYFLTEYYASGDLFDKIVQRGQIPEAEAKPMAARLVTALEKLRKERIIHRDIKPENVFFDDAGRPVVGDYGLCRQFGRSPEEQPWRQQEQWAHALVGTPKYLAPEAWRGEVYSYAVDVWSFGVMLYFALCGTLPFGLDHVHGEDAIAAAVLTRELVVEDGILTSDAEDFLRTILIKDPLRRPTWEQLKEHPWFDRLYVPPFLPTASL
ncbi:kinase-like domain-containing protein, partial [Cerioporus squamosus]